MNIPKLLKPVSIEEISLPSGEKVRIPKASPLFTACSKMAVKNDYGRRRTYPSLNEPTLHIAELPTLRISFQ